MHIFTSNYTLISKDGTTFLPGVRYVLPSHIAREMEQSLLTEYGLQASYRLSHFNSYERRYHGQHLSTADTLCIYRHGAIGDTLMTIALVAELHRRCPDARIVVYTRPGNVDLWHGLGVTVVGGFPIFEDIRSASHLFYENMLENDSEPDQGCSIDNLFQFAGIDPATVADERKVPVVVERKDDEYDWQNYPPQDCKYVVLHANASNPNRTYPHVERLVEILEREGMDVYCIGDGCRAFPKFRNTIPLVKHAALVICPDSSIGHLAAAFPSVPVISLWGLFHPNDRIRYYRNHHPLTGFSACPHAPCRSHEFILPKRRCKDAPTFDGKSCAVLASITPEMIVAKAKELLERVTLDNYVQKHDANWREALK